MNNYRLENPMTDPRLDPKPTESPTIECEVTVTVKMRMEVERLESDGHLLHPDNPWFHLYVADESFDKIIDKAREILGEGAGGYSVEYSE